jgi:hypothetical protein
MPVPVLGGKVAYVPYAAIVPPATLIKPVIAMAPEPGGPLVTRATSTMATREISSRTGAGAPR